MKLSYYFNCGSTTEYTEIMDFAEANMEPGTYKGDPEYRLIEFFGDTNRMLMELSEFADRYPRRKTYEYFDY